MQLNQTIVYYPTLFPVKVVEEYVVCFDSKETNLFYQNIGQMLVEHSNEGLHVHQNFVAQLLKLH